MAKLQLLAGSTSKTVKVFILDSSVTTGAGLTGLTNASGSLTAYYIREGAASAVQISLVSATLGTWTSSGFIVVDGTNMPGLYELGLPNAALASGAKSVVVMLKGATNMVATLLEIELTAVDNQSATAFITGVNSLAPPTNWNLESINASGQLDVIKFAGQTITAAAGVTLPSSVASPTNITAGTITTATNVGTVTNLTNAPTAGDFTAAMKTSLNAATPASVTGNVGGNIVGSVLGNVVGNVNGTVASVTTGVTVTTNNDKTGYSLSSLAVQAIWDALTSALTTVGSVGKRIADYLTGDAYARLGAPAGASVSADIAEANADLDELLLGAPPSASAIADAVLDAATGDHNLPGTIGESINLAGVASTVYGESGSETFEHIVYDTDDITPLLGVAVYVSSDIDGVNRSQTKLTDVLGRVQFDLNPGPIYVWRSRADRIFGDDPVLEVVS